MSSENKLILMPVHEYIGVDRDDPIRQYQKPFFGKFYRQRVEHCLAECRGGKKILEVGFGSGVTFLNLAKKYTEIHGVDLKANTEEITKFFASKGLNVFLRQANLLHLPYPDQSFDTVLLISILEHLQPNDLGLAFSEIWRVLKPGAQMVYGVPVDNKITRLGFRFLGYDITQHHFSTNQQIQNVAKAYFQPIAVTPMTGLGVKVYEIGNFTKSADY